MPKVKNVSPLGDLVVPALALEVKAGATITVDEEVAGVLLAQVGVWAPADKAAAAFVADTEEE